MRLHHTATDPPVAGVRVEPVMDQSGGGFVVCLIPESTNKPHRAEFVTNKPHYIRFGDDFVVMSQAVLRSMFFPRTSPRYAVRMSCQARNVRASQSGPIEVRVTIRNYGKATAREPFVVLRAEPCNLSSASTHANRGWEIVMVENGAGFSASASIHPGATAPTIRAHLPSANSSVLESIVVDCVIYSLDAEPSRFSTAFGVTDLLGGSVLTLDANEVPFA